MESIDLQYLQAAPSLRMISFEYFGPRMSELALRVMQNLPWLQECDFWDYQRSPDGLPLRSKYVRVDGRLKLEEDGDWKTILDMAASRQ